MTTLNDMTDAYIDEFITKLKEDISQKPSLARSPPASASSEKPVDPQLPSKIDISTLPWTIETIFY